jgi:hypothetical protein
MLHPFRPTLTLFFLLGAYEEGYLSVPVWFTAAPQDAESVQRNGVQNVDAGVPPVQYQQRFRVFGTGQSLDPSVAPRDDDIFETCSILSVPH